MITPAEYLKQFPREQLEAIDAATHVDNNIVRAVLSRVPPSWTMIRPMPSGAYFKRGSLQVGYTVQRYGGSDIWVHASVCGRKAPSVRSLGPTHESTFFLPTFEDLKRVKADFIGEDRWAYQVFPSSKDYVNHNPYVLHLYALMDGKPALPDFTMGLGTI